MPRHDTVTDEFVADLQAGFLEEAERVQNASTWPETQKRIVTGTYAFLTAMGRVEQGWTKEEITQELGSRTALGSLPNPLIVIGNRQIEDIDMAE
jgi:hypothetical protein